VLLVVIDSSENLENPENSEQLDSWPLFGEGTFAGVSGNDEDAPIPAVPGTRWNRKVRPLEAVHGRASG
jgi:hypothetical protein